MDGVTMDPLRHRLDVATYDRMIEAGIFGETDRIELIDGDLIDMAPIGQGHAAAVSSLTEALVIACAGRAIVSPKNPVRIDRSSEPQPDLAVLRRRADFYATGEKPGAADVLLLVEVADSSLNFDRKVSCRSTPGLGSRNAGSSTLSAARSRRTAARPATSIAR